MALRAEYIFYLALYCRSLPTFVLSSVQMVAVLVKIIIVTYNFSPFYSIKKSPLEQ